jgi:hypothetical protein
LIHWFNGSRDQCTNDQMRQSIESLDQQFTNLHQSCCDLIRQAATPLLYRNNDGESIGEQVRRSAAVVEQAFGGVTANLWDDPFEWTLPETLNTSEKVIEYLGEVEGTRRQAFTAFQTDDDLSREIMTPSGPIGLLPFLLDTLERARHHQRQAKALLDRLTV